MSVYFLPLIGFLAGVFIVSLGGGGGAVYVGVLTALCGISPELAASTSLATALPTTIAGTVSHWREGNVDVRLALLLLISAAVGAVGGTFCSTLLAPSSYRLISGALLLFISTEMLLSLLRRKGRAPRDAGEKLTHGEILKSSALGLMGGLMAGIVGLSGGGPITAALFMLHCPVLRVVGTSVAVISGMSLIGFLGHLAVGQMDWQLVLLLASGTICGAFAGPPLLTRLGRARAEKVLAPFIIFLNYLLGAMILFTA